jgi:stage II sporulation protein D
MSREQLNAKFPGFGHILSITPERTSKTGRLITARVVGNRGSQIFDADQLRNTLGLKSTWFSVTPLFSPVASAGNPIQSLPLGFQITGRGFGHGLGMSQWGAFNLAQKGYKYQQILSHYYQNTRLAQIDVR